MDHSVGPGVFLFLLIWVHVSWRQGPLATLYIVV